MAPADELKASIAVPAPEAPGLRRLFLVYLGVRLLLAGVTLLAGRFDYGGEATNWPLSEGGFRYRTIDSRFLDSLDRNDSRAYLAIASFGYVDAGDEQSNTAFFPGYAWLVRSVHGLLTRLVPALDFSADTDVHRRQLVWFHCAHLASTFAFLVFLVLLHARVQQAAGAQAAYRAGLLAIVSPLSFVFFCIMSESLFAALALAALVFAERSRWLLASLTAAAAAMVKSFGIVLALPLLMIWLDLGRSRADRPRQPAWLLFALLPAASYAVMLHLGEVTGDFLHYFRQQAEHFGHRSFPDLPGFLRVFDPRQKDAVVAVRDLSQILMMAGTLIGGIVFWRRGRGQFGRSAHPLFALLVFISTAFSGAVVSIARYLALPGVFYAGLGIAIERPRPFRVFLVAAFLGQALCYLAWIQNWRVVI